MQEVNNCLNCNRKIGWMSDYMSLFGSVLIARCEHSGKDIINDGNAIYIFDYDTPDWSELTHCPAHEHKE